MRAMTCRGAMLVTLLLAVTVVSTHGQRLSLAERFQARQLDAGPTSEDVTDSSVPMPTSPAEVFIEDEEDQTTNAPEQEVEEVVDQESPKNKSSPKPKNSLMQRTRDKMNRRRTQSRYGADNRPRAGSGPTRARLTPRPRTTTALPTRRRPTRRWRQRQRTTKSTTTLEPRTGYTKPQSSITTTQSTTSTTTLEPLIRSTEPQSSIPTTQTITSTTTLEPISIPAEPQSSILKTRNTTTTVQQAPTSTTILQPITTSTEPESSILTTQTATSTTTLEPITTSNEPQSSILTTRSTTLSTTQMTTTTTEADPTYPTEITEDKTLITPTVSRSSTTPKTSRVRFIPRRRRTTTARPKTTSTTTLEPITESTEPQSSIFSTNSTTLSTTQMTTTSPEADYTYPTEINEDIPFTTESPIHEDIPFTTNSPIPEDITFTPTDSPITFIQLAINTDDLDTTTTTTTTTAKSTTTTAPFPTTEASSQEIQTTEEAGHAGEVFLVEEEDIPDLKIPKPIKKPLIPKPVLVGSGVSVGVELKFEDPEFGIEQVGPVLIIGNSLRKRRQHHAGDNITDETDSLVTVQPVDTTINPFNDGFDENDFETTLGPISFNRRRTSTASPTTLNESPQNLSDASDTTIEANSEAENNVVRGTVNGGSFSDFQEITVGTKVNLGGPGRTSVTGEVIPVELENKSPFEKEHKSEGGIVLNEGDQTTLVSGRPTERPISSSILGSLFNYFAGSSSERPERPERPNRPRPERPQTERPEFRPFRPRPRPSGSRPDILPPRPSTRPNNPKINSDSSPNGREDTTIFPEDSLGDELPSRSPASPIRASIFRPPRPTGLLNKPSRPSTILPSKPIIESGFQGIPGENGESRPAGLFRPGAEVSNDYDYDADALPPSLPNLKIIPFVAADALNPHQQGGNIDSFTGDDFRISPQDKAVTTTARPTTTERSSRRPLPIGTRRPPILPPRRSPFKPSSNRRPSPIGKRPQRPGVGSRPSFIPPRTTTNRDKITSEENRIAPSTSSPFRLRFTTEKPFTPFTLATVEKTTESVQTEPEVEITTDDLPRTESITVNTPEAPLRLPGPIVITKTPVEVNTPEAPLRLPGPIVTTKTPVEVNTPSAPPRLPEPVITTKTPVEVNTPEARPPLRLPGPIRPIITSSQTSSISSSSSNPIKSSDISNLFLQDIFGSPEGTTRAPVPFIRATNKPVILKKTPAPLPPIPSLITNLFPLAPDPIVAQGFLKLSGCNIYGRMYQVDDRIKELSAECKECRCTPVGVQCLPVCA